MENREICLIENIIDEKLPDLTGAKAWLKDGIELINLQKFVASYLSEVNGSRICIDDLYGIFEETYFGKRWEYVDSYFPTLRYEDLCLHHTSILDYVVHLIHECSDGSKVCFVKDVHFNKLIDTNYSVCMGLVTIHGKVKIPTDREILNLESKEIKPLTRQIPLPICINGQMPVASVNPAHRCDGK